MSTRENERERSRRGDKECGREKDRGKEEKRGKEREREGGKKRKGWREEEREGERFTHRENFLSHADRDLYTARITTDASRRENKRAALMIKVGRSKARIEALIRAEASSKRGAAR